MRLRTCGYPNNDPFGCFDEVEEIREPDDFLPGDVLMLWGGMDIGTKLYGQTTNRHCSQLWPSERDKKEWDLIHTAVNLGIPILGVCRGMQLLTVYTGGTLCQHVQDHGRSHMVEDYQGNMFRVNSAHHQVCQPIHPAEILAWAPGMKGVGEKNEDVELDCVPEAIWFPQIKAFGVQYHPEWADCPKDAVDFARRMIQQYILTEEEQKEAA